MSFKKYAAVATRVNDIEPARELSDSWSPKPLANRAKYLAAYTTHPAAKNVVRQGRAIWMQPFANLAMVAAKLQNEDTI